MIARSLVTLLIVTGIFLVGVPFLLLSAGLELYPLHLGTISLAGLGLISLGAVVLLLCGWIFGSIGAGRAKLLITVGLAANMLVFLLLPRANSIVEIGALAFLDGICFSTVSPLSLSLLMLRTPKRRVGAAMGIYGAAEDVGLILGPLLGGVAWAQFGIEGAYLLLASSFAVMIAVFASLQRRL